MTAGDPMTSITSHAWLGLLVLGGVHGVNPAMGWLFAVGLGLQERNRRAVWRALGPLALGHALAIGTAMLLAAAIGVLLPLRWVKWGVAAALIGLGVSQFVRHRHPRWGGMRVGPRDLTIWSFLMASAHGAGLMALPFVLGAFEGSPPPHVHGAPAGSALAALFPADLGGSGGVALTAALIHTVGYLAATGGLAVLVYEKLGLSILKRAWINLTLVWVAALIVTGLLTPLL